MAIRLPRVPTRWTARLITAALLLVSVGAMQRDVLLAQPCALMWTLTEGSVS